MGLVGATPHAVVWRENKLRILHYARSGGGPPGPPVLVVYALVNRYPILDLDADRSVVRALRDHGLDVYLLDWGAPSSLDAHLTLDDYVNHYLDSSVDRVRERAGADRVSLLGYCQGGTLAAIHAALHPGKVQSLVLMAAPLAFEREHGLLSRWVCSSTFDPGSLARAWGTIPQEVLNPGFFLLRPVENAAGDWLDAWARRGEPGAVLRFLRLERWKREGVPQAGDAFAQFVRGIYQENRFAEQGIPVGGRVARLADVRAPVLLLNAEHDEIVPSGASLDARAALRRASVEDVLIPGGHFDLSLGEEAHRRVWPVVARWIRGRAVPESRAGKSAAGKRKEKRGSRGTQTPEPEKTDRARLQNVP